jgi:cell division protein ZapA
MGSVEVYILNQRYTIKGAAPEEHIQKLANYVNDRINEVYKSSNDITPLKASILAAIDIADELYRLKEEQVHLENSIEEKAVLLTKLFD